MAQTHIDDASSVLLPQPLRMYHRRHFRIVGQPFLLALRLGPNGLSRRCLSPGSRARSAVGAAHRWPSAQGLRPRLQKAERRRRDTRLKTIAWYRSSANPSANLNGFRYAPREHKFTLLRKRVKKQDRKPTRDDAPGADVSNESENTDGRSPRTGTG
jgi:hypothetical protein